MQVLLPAILAVEALFNGKCFEISSDSDFIRRFEIRRVLSFEPVPVDRTVHLVGIHVLNPSQAIFAAD